MHERTNQMTESTLYLKPLKLLTPEHARTLGIEADEPVLVSPYVPKQGSCEHCGQAYSPLRYAAGEVTQAQHLHDREGGIYLYYGRDPQLVIDVTHDTGFAGLVEPLSEVLDEQEKAARRASGAEACQAATARFVQLVRASCGSPAVALWYSVVQVLAGEQIFSASNILKRCAWVLNLI
jgi:hypothetical protein